MNIILSIAGINIEIDGPYEMAFTDAFLPFLLIKIEEIDERIEFLETDHLPKLDQKQIFFDNNIAIILDEKGKYWRKYFDQLKEQQYYAAAKKENDNTTKVYVSSEGKSHVDHLMGAFYHIGFENILIRRDRMIIHASCIDTKFGGILFSGPSGIGKSTQADLWMKYECSELINGDRPIIGLSEDDWRAYGSPYAGSSKCYKNNSVRIKALVLLGQADECSINKLNAADAFRRVYKQITVNRWDSYSVNHVCDLLNVFVGQIPVYEMLCTPDMNAVICLKSVLEEENRYGK